MRSEVRRSRLASTAEPGYVELSPARIVGNRRVGQPRAERDRLMRRHRAHRFSESEREALNRREPYAYPGE